MCSYSKSEKATALRGLLPKWKRSSELFAALMSSNKKKQDSLDSRHHHHFHFSCVSTHAHIHPLYLTASAAAGSHRLSSYGLPGRGLALVA